MFKVEWRESKENKNETDVLLSRESRARSLLRFSFSFPPTHLYMSGCQTLLFDVSSALF